MHRSGAAVALAGVLALAAGCGLPLNPPPGSSGASPSASPGAAGARPGASAGPSSGGTLRWTPCDGGQECAQLSVPLDATKPTGRTIQIALERARATGPDRVGSLLINPGGPGESTLANFVDLVAMLSPELRRRFDVVGFDPRGVGKSSPVRCVGSADLDRYIALDPDPQTAAGENALESAQRSIARGCAQRSGAILPFVGTRDVARDMDRIRAALGEQRLTYLGFSYGTLLGTRYAEQFPTRVRALALDGAIDPSLPPLANLEVQGGGFDRALAAFLADCRATVSCSWKPGGDLLTAYHRLMDRIRRTPLSGGDGRKVTSGLATVAVIATLYDKGNGWPALALALQQADGGDGSLLLQLADLYTERDEKGGYTNLQEANLAVTCRDVVWPTDVAAYEKAADDADRTAPEFGRTDVLSSLPCAFWPVRGLEPAAPSNARPDRPVLVVGTTGDPATPYSEAQALVRQIRGARLLTNVAEGHTGYGASSCVKKVVDAYLIDLTLPAGATRCGG